MTDNAYNRREWRKIRARKLQENPLCERCLKQGRTEVATVVHHRDGNEWNNDPDNLESLCRQCHELHHGRASIKGCDGDGWALGRDD